MQTGLYKHFKGNLYEVSGIAIHSETKEEFVVYKPVKSDQLFVRPKIMFEEIVTDPNGNEVERFTYLG